MEKLKQLQGPSIECPVCYCVTVIPLKGVDHLPKQLDVLGITEGSKVYEKCKHCIKTTYPPRSATLHCIDCQNFYCGACSDKTHLQVDNQNHIVRLASSNDDMRLSRNSSRTSSADSSSKYRRSPGGFDERSRGSSVSPSKLCFKQLSFRDDGNEYIFIQYLFFSFFLLRLTYNCDIFIDNFFNLMY